MIAHLKVLPKMHCFLIILLSAGIFAENWPQWRGAAGNGISSETGLATEWRKDKNIKWRTALTGPAPSTPVVWEDRIFLTSTDGDKVLLVGLNTGGEILWQQTLSGGNQDIREGESNAASPSPVTDGKHVWSFTGTGFLSCHNRDGNQIWKIDIQRNYGKFGMYFGMSTSPLLDGDRLYLTLMHDNAQLLIAFDKSSGKEIWEAKRETDARVESLHSYASPIMYRHDGQEFIIVHGSDYITGHRLSDGEEIWRCGGFQKAGEYNPYFRFVTSPVVAPGLIVAPSAKNGPVLGLNPAKASGDITNDKSQYHWRMDNNTSDVPSPLIHDGLVYICRENGVLICLDAASGERIYQERVYSRRHRGSLLYADGHIYLMAIDGTVSVIKAGKNFELVAQNSIGERCSASLAASNGVLYLRTANALYAIAK